MWIMHYGTSPIISHNDRTKKRIHPLVLPNLAALLHLSTSPLRWLAKII